MEIREIFRNRLVAGIDVAFPVLLEGHARLRLRSGARSAHLEDLDRATREEVWRLVADRRLQDRDANEAIFRFTDFHSDASGGGRLVEYRDRVQRLADALDAVRVTVCPTLQVEQNLEIMLSRGTSEPFDAVVAMYHDQGLPVLKHIGFGRAVNTTLGLPFIRTSVDHGTAFDIAGTGQADPGSLLAAVELATLLAGPRE